ncbi:SH3 domain-containing protein [Longispora urticae]
MNTLFRYALAVAGVALASVTALAAPAQAESRQTHCGWQPWTHEGEYGNSATRTVNIRTGNGVQCAKIGVLTPEDGARYRCTAVADDGADWTYLTNRRTGQIGWVRSDFLTFHSRESCGPGLKP